MWGKLHGSSAAGNSQMQYILSDRFFIPNAAFLKTTLTYHTCNVDY